MTVLDPALTGPPSPPGVMKVVEDSIFNVIETAIDAHPRSQQKRIGPSEVGDPCDRCLAHKLAGTPEESRGPAWKPAIGTAVHAQLEEWFRFDPNPDNEGRWLLEERVSVGEIDGVEITGSTDLYDGFTGTVVDHKVVGPKQLTKYRAEGPSQVYRVQAHLYARGWARRGELARQVAIIFYPRDGELSLAHFWSEPFDESIAVNALARATRLAQNVRAMQSIGPAALESWIQSLHAEPGCFGCRRYPGAPVAPPATPSTPPSSKQLLNL